jgi:hypothetical protein
VSTGECGRDFPPVWRHPRSTRYAIAVLAAARNVSLVSRTPSRGSFVTIKEPAEPRPTTNPSPGRPVRTVVDECVVQSLMIPLPVIVLHVLGDCPSETTFPERNHPIEALVLTNNSVLVENVDLAAFSG